MRGKRVKKVFFALKVEGGESDTVKGFFVKGLNTHVGEQIDEHKGHLHAWYKELAARLQNILE